MAGHGRLVLIATHDDRPDQQAQLNAFFSGIWVSVCGRQLQLPWGESTIDLPNGTHDLEVCPGETRSKYGLVSTEIAVHPGQDTLMYYRAPHMHIFGMGKTGFYPAELSDKPRRGEAARRLGESLGFAGFLVAAVFVFSIVAVVLMAMVL